MNKNTIIKVLSVLVIFAVIVTTVGCSIGGGDGFVKDGEVGAIDTEQLPTENGTAVFEGTVVNGEGKTETVTQYIDVENTGKPIVSDTPVDTEGLKNESVKDDYGMSDEKADDIIAKPEDWKTVYLFEYIQNNTDQTMITKSVTTKNEGDGSIFIRSRLDAEYGIGKGGVSNIAIYALVDMSKYPTEEDMEKAIDKMGIQVQYTLTDNKDADIDDWNSITTDVFDIK